MWPRAPPARLAPPALRSVTCGVSLCRFLVGDPPVCLEPCCPRACTPEPGAPRPLLLCATPRSRGVKEQRAKPSLAAGLLCSTRVLSEASADSALGWDWFWWRLSRSFTAEGGELGGDWGKGHRPVSSASLAFLCVRPRCALGPRLCACPL